MNLKMVIAKSKKCACLETVMEIIKENEKIQEKIFWVLKLCVCVTEKHVVRILHNAFFAIL